MQDYLKPLATKIKKLLPVNTYFTLDDGEQSFVVYPTQHINLINDFISIEVATVVYNNIKEHHAILEHLNELYSSLTAFSHEMEDYCDHCMVNPLECGTIRLIWGGDYIDQQDKDFENVNDLINWLKTNK